MFKQKWFRALFRRRILIALLIVLQVAFLVYVITSGSMVSRNLSRFLTLLSILTVLSVVSARDKGSYKTLWVFLLLTFPVFGGLLYLLITFQSATKRMRRQLQKAQKKAAPLYALPGDGYADAKENMQAHFPQVRYLQDYAAFPVYTATKTKYLPLGECFWEELLEDLKKAEHYIFLEFFIIQEGKMWNSILEILRRKAAAGVKVRVMYDDLGCFFMLPNDHADQLENMGIECAVFNPFRPFLTVKQNNRDHRKIVVIDGKVAFTGGINLADEYINAYEKHGHWKDIAVRLEGKAAWSFTLMFLEQWEVCKGTDEDFTTYYTGLRAENDGYVLPYCDNPMDKENVGEHVYLQILNEAKDYVYINTPYLILDDSLISALCLTAKRGVDVRIVTPHIWDKWAVHMTTRSYYRDLIHAGVRVYEYSKGFIHAKSFVSDDCIATIGTTNLDYRSLYLHFECGVWMYGSEAVARLKKDFDQTLLHCQRITEADCKASVPMKFIQNTLRLFAPLM